MARTRLSDLRRRPPAESDFRSPIHDPRVVARVGAVLGAAVVTAFLTGLLSHLHQHPTAWLPLPPVPVWGYRVSQGLHVAAGLAAIPLLLAKLYAAYPALFQQPRLRGPAHAVERASVAVLVATAIFQLVTGLLNIFQWYPWSFSFVRVHFAVAWVLVGSIVVHVAVKLPTITDALRRPVADPADVDGPTRRGFLAGVAVTVLGVTALTVGQTVRPLSGAALLSPRQAGVGVQGLPVNRTAEAAGVLDRATDPGVAPVAARARRDRRAVARRSRGDGPGHGRAARSRAWRAGARPPSGRASAWSTSSGWSASEPTSTSASSACSRRGPTRSRSCRPRTPGTPTPSSRCGSGEPLDLDHGFPARLIAPDRPGVLQTKWLDRIEVLG